MSSLFSIFDPQSFMGMSLNWLSAMLAILVIPMKFWMNFSQVNKTVKLMMHVLYKEFAAIVGSSSIPAITWISVALFFMIWMNNFLGLAPYIFTASSHLSMTLSLALPMWIGHVGLAWIKTSNSMFAHLVPLGSPMALAPFMVLIELVSAVIRPFTLAVRLAANMVAGHLLMVLLSSPACSSSTALSLLIISCLVLLAILESAVATIQAYVFSILTVLYVNEVNSVEMI